MLTKFIVLIILGYTHILNHYFVHLKIIQCYRSIKSQKKLEKTKILKCKKF